MNSGLILGLHPPSLFLFLIAREGTFTDYIAEKMQRNLIKEMETGECFPLAMFQ